MITQKHFKKTLPLNHNNHQAKTMAEMERKLSSHEQKQNLNNKTHQAK